VARTPGRRRTGVRSRSSSSTPASWVLADPIPALLAEFEARNPGVRVRSEALSWSADDQHQLYVIDLEGRSPGFHVMMLDVIWVPEFARAGWLLDLSRHVGPGDLAPFFPSTVVPATWGGRVWALPWNVNVGLLYYRTDLLTRHGLTPPVTWDDLTSAVRRVQAGERDPRLEGYLWQGKQYEGLVVNVLEAMWAAGTDLLDAGGGVFPDAGRAAEALGFLRGLITSGVSPPWVTAGDEELTRRAFGDGARHPELPRVHDLMLTARPRPVTPHYLLPSATLQPEFSAVLVGLKPPHRAIAEARRRLDYFLATRR
jgi:multiple sugar transport system substrate-binding protein